MIICRSFQSYEVTFYITDASAQLCNAISQRNIIFAQNNETLAFSISLLYNLETSNDLMAFWCDFPFALMVHSAICSLSTDSVVEEFSHSRWALAQILLIPITTIAALFYLHKMTICTSVETTLIANVRLPLNDRTVPTW